MTKMFKDLSELHSASIEAGDPSLFDSVLDTVIWRARREHEEEKKRSSSEAESKRLIPYRTVGELLQEDGAEFEWIVPGFLARGNVTELAGLPKLSGKTTLLLDMIAAVLKGEPWLGRETVKSKVMYLSEQGNNLREAFEIAGFDESTEGLYIVQKSLVRDKDWPEVARAASKVCDELGIDVLIVDTIAQFGEIDDENAVAPVRAALREEHRAAQDHNLAVAHTRHFGKKGMARGSSQFDADSDFLFTLKRPEGGEQDPSVRVLHGEGRSREIFKRLHIDLKDGGYVLLSEGDSDSRLKFNAARDAILEVLPNEVTEAMTVAEILEAIGDEHSKNFVKTKVIPSMVKTEQVERTCKGTSGDPYRYHRPKGKKVSEKSSVSVSYPPGSETDTDSYTPTFDNAEGLSESPVPEGTLVTDEDGLSEVIEYLEGLGDEVLVAADTETTGLEVGVDRVRTIQLATEETEGNPGLSTMVDVWSVDPGPMLKVLEYHPTIWHNAAFDLAMLRVGYGFTPRSEVIDTMILSKLAYPEWPRHDLATLSKNLNEGELKKTPELQEGWAGEITDEKLAYGLRDAGILLPLYKKLTKKLRVLGGLEWVTETETHFTKVIAEMSSVGIPCNPELWSETIEAIRDRLIELSETMDRRLPEDLRLRLEQDAYERDYKKDGELRATVKREIEVDRVKKARVGKTLWGSSDVVADVLEELFGVKMPLGNPTKTGKQNRKTGKDVLPEVLEGVDDPLVEDLLEFRKLQNAPTAFEKASVTDSVLRPSWQQIQAITGRMSCQKPPFQNIPKSKVFIIRKAVEAPEGKRLVVLDYNQAEIRVLAAVTQDANLREALLDKKRDVHNAVAARLFEVETPTPEQRKIAKMVVFGTCYGQQAAGLASKLSRDLGRKVTRSEAKKIIDNLLTSFPGIRVIQERLARERASGQTVFRTTRGRRRIRVTRDTQTLNSVIQGGAADMLKYAAVELQRRRNEGEGPAAFDIVALIHDEVILVTDEEKADEVRDFAKRVLESAGEEAINVDVPEELRIPVTVDGDHLRTWSEKDET